MELSIPTDVGTHVYDTIVAAGDGFRLRHAGYHALNSLRIEKAYRHWGHDMIGRLRPHHRPADRTRLCAAHGAVTGDWLAAGRYEVEIADERSLPERRSARRTTQTTSGSARRAGAGQAPRRASPEASSAPDLVRVGEPGLSADWVAVGPISEGVVCE